MTKQSETIKSDYKDTKKSTAVNPDTGKILWQYPSNGTAEIMPISLAASIASLKSSSTLPPLTPLPHTPKTLIPIFITLLRLDVFWVSHFPTNWGALFSLIAFRPSLQS